MKKVIFILSACAFIACAAMSGCGEEASSQAQTTATSATQAAAQDATKAKGTTQPTAAAETEVSTTKAADYKAESSGGEETPDNNFDVYGGMREDEAIAEALGSSGGTVVSVEKGKDSDGSEEWVIGVKEEEKSEVVYHHVKGNSDSEVETPLIY